jgi:hypothetical protein
MTSKKLVLSIVFICLIASVAAYEILNNALLNNNQSSNSGDDSSNPEATTSPTTSSTTDPTAQSDDSTSDSSNSDNGSSSSGNVDSGSSTNGGSSTTTDSSENAPSHEEESDYIYNGSEAIQIVLKGDSIITNSSTVTVSGSIATITSAGTYRISGSLANGQVIVNTHDTKIVQLILAGVDISCSSSAPIYIINSDKTLIILEANTQNALTYTSSATAEPKAALFSKSDLTIYGDGLLDIQSPYSDGVSSKDGLIIKSGTITVNAQDDGIRGKDYIIVESGKISVTAGENGLISDNTADSTKGYVSIQAGIVTVASGGDAIEGQTDVIITSGQVTITSGGGSSSGLASGVSAKGIKGLVSVTVTGGTVTANSADDTIHSNGTVTIGGATILLSSGDDGIHADSAVTINSGNINIQTCYEGIEAVTITISSGTIYLNSSDDGLNGAGGQDSSGFAGGPGGMGGGDIFSGSDANLYINGGYLVVYAGGDGLDSNGAITQTAGTVIVNGPIDNGNGPLDFSTYKMTGGFLIAVGSSGMAQALTSTSTQCSVLVNFQTSYAAGTLIHVESSTGSNIVTFKTTKLFQSVVVCASSLHQGSTYNIYVGGSSTGSLKDGINTGGTYSGGTLYKTFTLSSTVTSIGSTGGMRP